MAEKKEFNIFSKPSASCFVLGALLATNTILMWIVLLGAEKGAEVIGVVTFLNTTAITLIALAILPSLLRISRDE